jgi:tetratricopeptide (TPR) repeat protein
MKHASLLLLFLPLLMAAQNKTIDAAKTKITTRDYAGAVSDLNETIKKEPGNAMAFYLRATAQLALQDTAAFFNDTETATRLDASYVEAYRSRAKVYENMWQYPNAVKEYDKLIQYAPKDPNAYGERGFAKEMAEDFEGAEADYLKDLQINPKNVRSLDRMANLKSIHSADYAGANAYLDKLLQIAPNDAEYLRRKGQNFQFNGQYQEAIMVFDQLVNIKAADGMVFFYRGMAYHKINQSDKACADLKTAEGMGNSFAQQMIPRLCQ